MTPQEQCLAQIHKLNNVYKDEMLYVLMRIYHLTIHEDLTLTDLQSIGERYNLDLSNEYHKVMKTLEDEDE